MSENICSLAVRAPESFKRHVDAYAKRNRLSRSAAMMRLLTEALDADDVRRRDVRGGQ